MSTMGTEVTDLNGRESRVDVLALQLREQIICGELRPRMQLSEQKLAADLKVSRNTLREVFRLLTSEGLLKHLPNRGVFVASPTMATIVEIYRVRKLIEVGVLRRARTSNICVQAMRGAVATAQTYASAQDWRGVGSSNMEFHMAIVSLSGSARLTAFFSRIIAELRLAFGLIEDAEALHRPYIHRNSEILALIEEANWESAAELLERYLIESERDILDAFVSIEQT